MFVYAILNDNNICDGVSVLSGEVNQSNMIEIENNNLEYYIGRKYENGMWSAEKYETQTTSPLTDYEESKQRIDDLETAMAAVLGGAI